MAVLKHIKNRNANYSDALEYLLFQHDEKSGKVIYDDLGRKLLREEYYMDGLNCEPMAFDLECKRTNAIFHKNQNQKDIKSHHYIISFDPKDAVECGLTGQRAHELSMELTRKIFSGYQALVVTHTDGGNHSGNIHTHIVINSVRKYDAPREGYMTQPGDHKAGRKHRSTNKFLEHFKKEVMEMCEREGLHQIDLLSPAPEKVTEAEFRIRARGQKKIEQMNQAIKKEGLTPTATVFQTQKDFLRKAIKECSRGARSFEEFQDLLLEDYNISVISQRGRYRYLHPDRNQRITEKTLGTDYGREYLEGLFVRNAKMFHASTEKSEEHFAEADYHINSMAVFYCHTQSRLVKDLQTNVKAMQSEANVRNVKIGNLQQMANTLIYIQEHGYGTRQKLEADMEDARDNLRQAQKSVETLNAELKTLNSQIHYTGQYFASKGIYAESLKAKLKGKFRHEHASEIRDYEEARAWLQHFYPEGKVLPLKTLKVRKDKMLKRINDQKVVVSKRREHCTELEIILHNTDMILKRKFMERPLDRRKIAKHSL